LKYHAEGGWGQQAKELDQVESLDRAICLVLEAVEGGGWALLEEELRELQHENLTARPDLEELDEAAREAALLRGFPYKRGWPGNAREAAAEAVVLAERAQKGGKQRWVKDIRAMFLALANDSDDPKEVPTLEQLRRWAVSLRKTLEK